MPRLMFIDTTVCAWLKRCAVTVTSYMAVNIMQETQTTNLWGEYLANISENNGRIETISHLLTPWFVLLLRFVCLFLARQPPVGQSLLIHEVSRSHTMTHHSPLDEWSARRRDLYLTTHNTHKRQTSMPSVGFEPTIWVGERPQTYTLDRAATEIGSLVRLLN